MFMPLGEKDFFSAFVSVSKAISSTRNLKDVLDLIVKHGIDSLDMKAGAISLWNKKENRLELITQRNLSQEFINKGPILADPQHRAQDVHLLAQAPLHFHWPGRLHRAVRRRQARPRYGSD